MCHKNVKKKLYFYKEKFFLKLPNRIWLGQEGLLPLTHRQRMKEKQKKSVIDVINQLPWGTHVCLFYQSRNDLIDILVPYFRQGLEENELCVWATSESLEAEEAEKALKKAVKNLDYYIKKGQIEILDARTLYAQSGKLEAERVLKFWAQKEKEALEKEFDGLRVSGNPFCLEKEEWRNFVDYESDVNNVIENYRMKALCCYSLEKCGAFEVIDLVSNHQFALIKRDNKWELIENSIHEHKEKAYSEANARLRILQKVSEAVHSSLVLENVFKQITEGAVHIMGYTTAFIITLDEAKRDFKIRALSTKERLESLIGKILGLSLWNISFPANPELNSTIRSVMNGKIVVAKNLAEIAYPIISEKKCSALQMLRETKNYIVVPLKVESEVVGGVLISSSREDVTDEELGIIKSFAHAASSAIKNANLHLQAKQTQEELRKSEEKYKFLVDNSTEIILILSKRGKILFANKIAMNNFGYSEEELIGHSIINFVTKDSIRKALYALAQEFLGRPQPEMEVKAKTKSGEIRYLEVTKGSAPIYENKKLIGVMISATDITGRKKAYEELKSSEERLKILYEYAPDAYYLNDLKGNFVNGNIAAEKMTGYNKEDLIGKSFLKLKLLPPGQIPKAAAALAKNVLGQPTGPDEFVLYRKDGSQVPVEIRTFPVKIIGQSLVLSIVRDITERKKAEERIKASLKEKEILLQEIHHRVKNNMQIISSLLMLQSRTITDKQALETLQSSQNRVRSMALIHERLYRSKDFERVDFAEYARSLTGHLISSYGINSKLIRLDMDIKDVSLDINTAIPCSLIVNELISNSLKHAFPDGRKGEIKIAMHPLDGNEIELIVSDNGIGIPEEVDFRKTESLGLYLVYILAEDQLDGKIKLERSKGTRFQIRLRKKIEKKHIFD